MNSRPTLQDVAQEAGVSTATVSRSLSSPVKVRPEVRSRVQAAIKKLGYAPVGAARALASGRTNTVGAVIPTLDNAIFARVIQTLQDHLSATGRTLLLASSDYRPDREFDQINNLIIRGLDGLLLTGEERDPDVYRMLQKRGIRYVNTYVHRPDSPHPSIGFDNVAAMEKIVSYLHDLGHRTYGMIAGIVDGNDRARARLVGVQNALLERECDFGSDAVVERPYSIKAGRDGFRRLMASTPRPTAVLCGNDILAIGAMLEAGAMGLDVPADVSITGFDDLDLSREIVPSLTTIHAPLEEMGKAAAGFLVDSDSEPPETLHIEFKTELVVRGSTGPMSTP